MAIAEMARMEDSFVDPHSANPMVLKENTADKDRKSSAEKPAEENAEPAAPELRTWTSLKGSTVEATFVSLQAGMVVLETKDGRNIKIRKTALSKPDQEYLADR